MPGFEQSKSLILLRSDNPARRAKLDQALTPDFLNRAKIALGRRYGQQIAKFALALAQASPRRSSTTETLYDGFWGTSPSWVV